MPLLVISLLVFRCTHAQVADEKNTSITYTNPVFEPVLADPSVLRGDDGWFYAYGTMDNWGDGKGAHLVPILRSPDLVKWTYLKDAFLEKPGWKKEGGLWAPDVVKVKNRYLMYYAYSTWGDPNPGIGIAMSEKPEGPFSGGGKLFSSDDVQVPNSIDPHFFEDQGDNYLFWGSFSAKPEAGTYALLLSEDGIRVEDLTKKVKIAAGDFEAVMIHKKGQYYYFIGSKGSCCEGADSKYQLWMGRSKNVLGPYVDRQGKPLTESGAGSLLLKGNEKIVGPGHNSRILTDEEGVDWLLYHAIDPQRPYIQGKVNRRVLMLDRLHWLDEWPKILKDSPTLTPQERPVFRQ